MPQSSPQPSALDKKRTVILLRSVVTVSTSYLIIFGDKPLSIPAIAYILAVMLSNIVLARTPRHWFQEPRFSAALLLVDTAVVLAGLYLTVGCFSQDFLIIYFFTIFLTTATSSMTQIALGAALISSLYGYWLWLTTNHTLGEGEWLRLPFFFVVAVFYAYVTEETKQERWRRQQAERESDRLRVLLHLSDAFSQRIIGQAVTEQIGGLVQAAFPRLACVAHVAPVPDASKGTVFPFMSHGRTFGALQVTAPDGSALGQEEEQFCKVAAAVAANGLYAAEQTGAADDGMRLKEEFLTVLSHELRSPLHSILGNADILAESLEPSPDTFAKESVVRLRAGAFRLLHLIEEMLCFAELRAGRATVVAETVDLQELCENFSSMMTDELGGRPIRFECTVEENVRIVQTDLRKLRLIINALLSNAAKFTHQGFVRLSARRTGQHIEIAVQDSGIGIDARDLGPIFQEFRQLDGSLTRRYDGLGLGLALAQQLAAVLGGRIDVESVPNRGSSFFIRLPSKQLAVVTRVVPPVVQEQALRAAS